jgi:hypothetical protein
MQKVLVVIGAGVAGMSTLYNFSRNPEWQLIGYDNGKFNAPNRDTIKIRRIDDTDKAIKTDPDLKSFVENKSRAVGYESRERYRAIASKRREPDYRNVECSRAKGCGTHINHGSHILM